MDAVGGARTTTRDWSSEESTNAIVKRDTLVGVDIQGKDASHREVVTKQKAHVGAGGRAELGHAAFEGAGVAGLHVPVVGIALEVASPLVALGIGLYALHEAQEKGKAQSAALTQEYAHVAVIATLDLPTGYKCQRLEGDFKHVSKESSSRSAKMTEALNADPKGRAVLQHHCDRGIKAAEEMSQSGQTKEAYLAANPKIAEAYAKDAAFHEGFDASVYTKEKNVPGEIDKLMKDVDGRNGWNARESYAVRG